MAYYDVNSAIDKPNMLAMVNQGMQFGQQQRALREEREDKNALRSLAPQILAGDQAAYDKAYAINPEVADQAQQSGDNQLRRLKGGMDYLKAAMESGNPQRIAAAEAQVGPYVSRMAGKPWQPGSLTADPAAFEQAYAKIAMLGPDKQAQEPAGFRQAHLTAVAAGYQPGSEEYKQAMRVAARLEAPAVAAGYSVQEVPNADGSVSFIQVPTRGVAPGSAVPVSVGGQAPQPAPQQSLAASGGDPQMDALSKAANAMIAAGVPPEQVDAFLMQTAQASPNVQVNPPTMAPMANAPMPAPANMVGGGPFAPLPGSGRGPIGFGQTDADRARAAASQAAQVEAAKLGTQQQFAPRQAELDAQRETAVVTARETAATQAAKAAALPQVIAKSDQTLALINKALNHPGREVATGKSGALGLGNIPGTDGRDFMAVLDQLKGQTFLEAFQSLKGGGAITQVEGTKAEQAIARLDVAQSDAEFAQALRDLAEVAEAAKRRALEQAQGDQPAETDDDALIRKYL